MNYGFIRGACITPELKVADCIFNTEKIIEESKKAVEKGASIIVFPELSITGYTCGDLFFQRTLQNSAEKAVGEIALKTTELEALIFAGVPVALNNGIFNCAAAIFKGQLVALIAKSYIPNYGEFYERRQFTPFPKDSEIQFVNFAGFENVPLGTNILIQDTNNSSFTIGCEICEDLWVTNPPSSRHSLAGATVIVNLSAGNEIIGKAEYRRSLVKSQSSRTLSAYLYAGAGHDESTQDMIFAGHNMICENGTMLAESSLFTNDSIFADIDVERLCQERRHTTSFSYSAGTEDLGTYEIIQLDLIPEELKIKDKLLRYVDPHPFVPSDKQKREKRSLEVITLQAEDCQNA